VPIIIDSISLGDNFDEFSIELTASMIPKPGSSVVVV